MIGVIYQFYREREGGKEIPAEHSIPIQSTGEKEQDHQQSDEHLSGLTAIEIVCVCLRRSTTQYDRRVPYLLSTVVLVVSLLLLLAAL